MDMKEMAKCPVCGDYWHRDEGDKSPCSKCGHAEVPHYAWIPVELPHFEDEYFGCPTKNTASLDYNGITESTVQFWSMMELAMHSPHIIRGR